MPLSDFFAKYAFLVFFDSLFHTAGDDAFFETIGSTSNFICHRSLFELLRAMLYWITGSLSFLALDPHTEDVIPY